MTLPVPRVHARVVRERRSSDPPPRLWYGRAVIHRHITWRRAAMDNTTGSSALEAFVQTMTERMASLARTLGTWVQAEPRTLQQQEEQLLCQLHELGTTLLSGLLARTMSFPPPSVTCPCGASATFRRLRPATITTLLGRLTYSRATYECASCKSGHAPLDQQLQVAAGSFSLGLQELLALLG